MARLRKLIRRTLRCSPKWAFSVQILNDFGGRVLTLGTQNNLNLIKYAIKGSSISHTLNVIKIPSMLSDTNRDNLFLHDKFLWGILLICCFNLVTLQSKIWKNLFKSNKTLKSRQLSFWQRQFLQFRWVKILLEFGPD